MVVKKSSTARRELGQGVKMLLIPLADIVYDRYFKRVSQFEVDAIPWSAVPKREVDAHIERHMKRNGSWLERYKWMKEDPSCLTTPPVLVYKKDDGKYGIVGGLERYWFYEKLNEEHPGEGWDKIPVKIVFQKEPTDKEIWEYGKRLQQSGPGSIDYWGRRVE